MEVSKQLARKIMLNYCKVRTYSGSIISSNEYEKNRFGFDISSLVDDGFLGDYKIILLAKPIYSKRKEAKKEGKDLLKKIKGIDLSELFFGNLKSFSITTKSFPFQEIKEII